MASLTFHGILLWLFSPNTSAIITDTGSPEKVVRLKRITCFSAAVSLKFQPQLFEMIVSLQRSSRLHGGSPAPPAQGRGIGPQQEGKCAFNLHNPFNLSSIMCKQPAPLISIQLEGKSQEPFFLQKKFSLLSNLTKIKMIYYC